DQIGAQYKLAKIGAATGGRTVVETGTVLEVKKGGLAAVAQFPRVLGVCPSKFEGGDLKGPASCASGFGGVGAQNIRYFAVGEKVYPVEIKVDAKKDKIVVVVIECQSTNAETGPSSYMARVDFQFAKGYLGTASAGQIEDTIGQVFTISTLDPQQSQSDQKASDQQQPSEQEKPDPQTIHLGQTIDQVLSALGKPDKIVDLGAKQIYVYKDLKVTFVNGKVSDVQ
ncbi:MAG: hypothetical protein WAM89_19835, partial [Terriglobales bacterium]